MKSKGISRLIVSVATQLFAICAAADQGGVNISGSVMANTCTVSDTSKVVALPDVAASDLNTAGSVAGETSFTINFSGCLNSPGSGTPYFESNGNISGLGRLRNVSGTATNVEVELLNSNGTSIDLSKLGGSQSVTATPIIANGGTMLLKARYVSMGAAQPGTYSASLSYTMYYQ